MHTPIANALRDILAHVRKNPAEFLKAPFANSRLIVEMPNTTRDIGVAEAIARYEAAIRKACEALRIKPLGTTADIRGLPIFLCPLVGSAVPSVAPVISKRLGPPPMRVDAFDGIGVTELESLIENVEAWLKAPTFGIADYESEIRAGVADVGDALFAASA